jgi:hypothetical protein
LSFNVLVIPEDFRRDEPLLKPIVERMLEACGRKARVRVCKDPLLGGVGEALKSHRIQEVLDRYRGSVHLFLLVVDRDGLPDRRNRLTKLEEEARKILGPDRHLLAENAWQEVEAWILAGMKDLPKSWKWNAVRAEAQVKETYFEPYVRQRGLAGAPFGGRQRLGQEAAANYDRIRKLCPEDVAALEERIRRLSPDLG